LPPLLVPLHLGTESVLAIALVLYVHHNPGGKLHMTFPRSVRHLPIYYNYKNTGRPSANEPNSVFWSHYTDESNAPLYPFGHGLSYTSFAYSDLKTQAVGNNEVEVTFTVKNTGKVKGKEVAQLYIRDWFASVTRPVKELKGFELVELAPNEEQQITLKLTDKELGFYNNEGEFIIEPGKFSVFVGGSSNTVLEKHFEL